MATDLRAKFHPVLSWLRYRRRAETPHGIHSPFIYDLFTTVIRDKAVYPEYDQVENIRRSFSRDRTPVEKQQLGAGSRNSYRTATVSGVAGVQAIAPRYGQLLFRLARKFKPYHIVELGTSLGISTHYLALGNPEANVSSVEGHPALAGLASEMLRSSGLTRAEVSCGDFDAVLPQLLQNVPAVGLAYVDGNHTYEATIRYFHLFMEKMAADGILVFDDIYWSPGMSRAWEEIIADPRVQYSIDLYRLGLIFLRPVRVKQHFVLKF